VNGGVQRWPVVVDEIGVARPAWIHLTAKTTPLVPELCREDTGVWLFSHLREAFPRAIAAVLMPDHPHLVLASTDARAAERRLTRLLGQLGRVFGVRGAASLGATSRPIRPGLVLARQVRYVALNPCRARYVSCPLAWSWSTHRDVIGAVVDPWVTASRLAAALQMPESNFVARHHAYVSGDPDAHVASTPLPVPANPTAMPSVPLRTIAEAVSAATRQPIAAIRRRGIVRTLFVALAFDQGWDHLPKLAEVCGCGVRSIRDLARGTDPAALQAARLCLGDSRLRSLGMNCTRRAVRVA